MTLSKCGNFVLIGYTSGHVDKFNIQSGIFRGSLKDSRDWIREDLEHCPAHAGRSIRGIATDALNKIIITGDNVGLIKFWRFTNHNLIKGSVAMDSAIKIMELHRENSLMAVCLDDISVHIMDVVTRKIVRVFNNIHDSQITDLAFSTDSRWLITSSLDKTLKVWDVTTGNLIDHLGFTKPIVSLSISPTSDFLATSHLDDLGIYLWSNKSLYGHVAIKPLDKEASSPAYIRMPTVKSSQEEILENAMDDLELKDGEDEEEEMEADWSKEQIGSDMITLAGLPPSRWQNLHNLDVIKMRNKPKEAVYKPKSAPFFLPTIVGPDGQTRFQVEDDDKDKDDGDKKVKSVAELLGEQNLTTFGQKLWDSRETMDIDAAQGLIADLKEKGASAIDLEITSLSPEGGGSVELMAAFLKMCRFGFEGHRDYEAVNAYLGLFLKHHSDSVLENKELSDEVEQLRPILEESWSSLKKTLSGACTLLAFSKNSLVSVS